MGESEASAVALGRTGREMGGKGLDSMNGARLGIEFMVVVATPGRRGGETRSFVEESVGFGVACT